MTHDLFLNILNKVTCLSSNRKMPRKWEAQLKMLHLGWCPGDTAAEKEFVDTMRKLVFEEVQPDLDFAMTVIRKAVRAVAWDVLPKSPGDECQRVSVVAGMIFSNIEEVIEERVIPELRQEASMWFQEYFKDFKQAFCH